MTDTPARTPCRRSGFRCHSESWRSWAELWRGRQTGFTQLTKEGCLFNHKRREENALLKNNWILNSLERRFLWWFIFEVRVKTWLPDVDVKYLDATPGHYLKINEGYLLPLMKASRCLCLDGLADQWINRKTQINILKRNYSILSYPNMLKNSYVYIYLFIWSIQSYTMQFLPQYRQDKQHSKQTQNWVECICGCLRNLPLARKTRKNTR